MTTSFALTGCSDIAFPERATIRECVAFYNLYDVHGSSNAAANVEFEFAQAKQSVPQAMSERDTQRLPFFSELRLSGRIEGAVTNRRFKEIDQYVQLCAAEIQAWSAR